MAISTTRTYLYTGKDMYFVYRRPTLKRGEISSTLLYTEGSIISKMREIMPQIQSNRSTQ